MPEGQIPTPERATIPTPEQEPGGIDVAHEHPVPAPDRATKSEPAPVTPLPVVTATEPVLPTTPDESAIVRRVETIMSDGLEETYQQLDPTTQARFRAEGERTATMIGTMLQATKVQTKKIVELLLAWLRIIPGVNRFFLEQEAKIKADKLLALRNTPPQ